MHGSVLGASVTWRKQQPLAEHWTLCTPNRPGFGASPASERGDFEAEAPLIAELLGDGAHLVGHSYGAVIALFAAALRPDAVRSLTVSEPGSLTVAAGNPAVDAVIESGNELFRRGSEMDPREMLVFFRSGVGSAHYTPEELEGDEGASRGVDADVTPYLVGDRRHQLRQRFGNPPAFDKAKCGRPGFRAVLGINVYRDGEIA